MSGKSHTEAVEALRGLAEGRPLPRRELPYAGVLRNGERELGPFPSLPSPLREELRACIEEDESLRTLACGGAATPLLYAGAAIGRLLYGLEKILLKVRSRVSPGPRPLVEGARQKVRRWARQATHLPFRSLGLLARRQARQRVARGEGRLRDVLRADGADLGELAFDYAEGLRQVPGCAAVLRAPATVYSAVIGIDFIASAGRLWLLEANCNPALMDARLSLYRPGEDAWVERILDTAVAEGFRRIRLYGYRPFSPGHARALEQGGQRRGIDVTIVDDLFSARHDGHPRAWRMDARADEGCFVVRAKTFDVLFDRALLSKRRTRQIVAPHAARLEEAGVSLARWLGPGETVPTYAADSPYPSIVAKIDGLDRGAGVSFYKVPSISTELAAKADYCEEYHVPDPCTFRILEGRREELPAIGARAWKVRSYGLLTPQGVVYLSSIKVISGLPVPQNLPDGPVAQKRIFLATINEGGVYSAVTPEEDASYGRAVEAVGGVFLDWLNRRYSGDAIRTPRPVS